MIKHKAILFVCLGNICRSPLAEAAFRSVAAKRGLEVEIDSAGTADYHIGKAPDPRSIAMAGRMGIDISHYRARQICKDDYHRFTDIFALDHTNLNDIIQRAPADAAAKIGLLLDAVDHRAGEAVRDPYYGDSEDFEQVWDEVYEAANALADKLICN